jgi:hypothetical protein
MHRKIKRSIKLPCAGFSRVEAALVATVRESEQGFCVKAVRKPIGCNDEPMFTQPQSVLESLLGIRLAGQNICTKRNWSSSENNNNNAWNQSFSTGSQNNNNKNNSNYVRAIRGFTQKQSCSKIVYFGTTHF